MDCPWADAVIAGFCEWEDDDNRTPWSVERADLFIDTALPADLHGDREAIRAWLHGRVGRDCWAELDELGGFRRGDRVKWERGGRRGEGRIWLLFSFSDDYDVAWVNVGPAGDVMGGDVIEVVETRELNLAPDDGPAKGVTANVVEEVRE